ncbi:MAG: DUF4476 domain-containing protein [Deltaproteobacteria bacterium]|nr:DUF4476 domain-containing protein [Deltaproteobacteria bacterium]
MHPRIWLTVLVGCLLTSPAFAKRPTGKGPCQQGEDCQQGSCLEVGGDRYCSTACGSCPYGMECNTQLFGGLNLPVCVRPATARPSEVPPRMLCGHDDECPGSLICGQAGGLRACTLPCRQTQECGPIELSSLKVQLYECRSDEGQAKRQACLPKPACLNDPRACATPVDPGPIHQRLPEPRMTMPRPGLPPAPPAPPPAPPAPAPIAPMAEARFLALLEQVKAASFSEDRMQVIKTAAAKNHFRSAQVSRLLETTSFEEEKNPLVVLLAPKIVDRENQHIILEAFSFSSSREEAAKVLGRY